MNDNILSALQAIDVSALARADWIAVGMALKQEGYPCSVWDDWSRPDKRYHAGECEKKWEGFQGSSNPVTGATIIQMAQDRGWQAYDSNLLDWDDVIEDDSDGFTGFPEKWDQTQDLITYLETLFKPDDYVGYVTSDVWQNDDGKWLPSKGVYTRTAGELIASLKKYHDKNMDDTGIGYTVGDWNPEAGAWIRFNPLDGSGVKNENVTDFRYALVESDTLPVAEQDAVFRRLELPIAALVHSGSKSLHAIVHIDAQDYDEYKKRVDYLYKFLDDNKVTIDKQNRNPSRLSRMPGATRNGNRQYLVDTNIGRKSWTDWMDFAEGVSDELPDMVSLGSFTEPPELPEELIKGILRRGHKMLVSGPSKAGKSFLLMELCIAIAEGSDWLGFQCKKGRVLYVNLEIDPASTIDRFFKIYQAKNMPMTHSDDIAVWSLRGHAVPMDQLVPKLIRRIRDQHFDAVVIDPIYKVITGDENNASDMGAFCNQFDKICESVGCSVIYCHHHSKGAQGMKRSIDRASGSGVFARDPDACLDIIELELTEEIKYFVSDNNSTAWRLETNLREFANIRPLNFWFEYPIHRLDENNELKDCAPSGSTEAGQQKNGKRTTPEQRRESLEAAFEVCKANEPVTVSAMAEFMEVSQRCVRDRINENKDEFYYKGGFVFKVQNKTEEGN